MEIKKVLESVKNGLRESESSKKKLQKIHSVYWRWPQYIEIERDDIISLHVAILCKELSLNFWDNHFSEFNCREKNQRLSSIFDSCWRNKVSNFRLGKFAKVEPFYAPNEADVDINTKKSKSNSGSNETMQKVLASTV